MKQDRLLDILNVGQSLASYGGVANQQRRVIDYMPATVRIQHVSTMLARVEIGAAENLLRYVVAWFRVLVRMIVNPPDVMHLYISQRGSVWRKALMVPLGRLRGVPTIMHSQGSEIHLFYRGLRGWKRAVVTAALRSCDGMIVLSESWRRFFVEEVGLDASRVAVMPNTVEVPEAVPDRQGRSGVTIAFLGRIGRRKGAFELIEAFASLEPTLRERARLVLGGDGEVERARELADRLGCGERVELRGWLDDAGRNALLEQADVFVLPTYNEGLPLALLDGMSWALASISTPVGGIPEVLEHERNGLMVEPGDVAGLRDALARLIEDEPLRLRLGAAGRRTAQELDVRQYVQRLEVIYRKLTRRDPIGQTPTPTPAVEEEKVQAG